MHYENFFANKSITYGFYYGTENRENNVKTIIYSAVSLIVMIATMIFTKKTPIVFLDIIGSALNTIFPVVDYYTMTTPDANIALTFIAILSEWFIGIFGRLFDDSDNKYMIWAGNTFLTLSISMLNSVIADERANNLIGFLQLIVTGYFIFVVIYNFIRYGISGRSIISSMKMVYTNPILIGFFISLIRLGLPLILMSIPLLILGIIPIRIIQAVGVIVILFLGYFFKQYSDKLVDKIDKNDTAKCIRFIAAFFIIIAEIVLAMGHTLPSAN